MKFIRLFLLFFIFISKLSANLDFDFVNAAIEYNRPFMEELLNRGVSINAQNPWRETALHYALQKREPNKDCIRFLLEKGADITILNNRNQTPITYTAGQGDVDLMQLLLKQRPDIKTELLNNQDAIEYSPLTHAIANNQVEMVNYLISEGAEIRWVDIEKNIDQHVLPLGFSSIAQPQAVNQIIDPSPAIEIRFPMPSSKEIQETRNKALKILASLVNNTIGRQFISRAAFYANAKGFNHVVEFLIENGLDPNSKIEQFTILMACVRSGNAKAVYKLLQKGADPFVKDDKDDDATTEDYTALNIALKFKNNRHNEEMNKKNTTIINLLEFNINPEIFLKRWIDLKDGSQPLPSGTPSLFQLLSWSIDFNKYDVFEELEYLVLRSLLTANEPSLIANEINIAFMHAVKLGHIKIVQLLVRRYSNNIKMPYLAALKLAADKGHFDVFTWLLIRIKNGLEIGI